MKESLVAICLEIKRSGRKADDSHVSNAEVKNRGTCKSAIIFHAVGQWSVDYIQ